MGKQISIGGHDFDVVTPYAEGHSINAAEAKALNQTRAENVANNWRKRVKEAGEDKPALAKVRKEFADYDAGYVFTLAAAGGSRSSMTPLEKECRKVARAWLVNELKKNKITIKAYTETHDTDYVKTKVAEIAEVPAIKELAAQNLKDAEKLAQKQLDVKVAV